MTEQTNPGVDPGKSETFIEKEVELANAAASLAMEEAISNADKLQKEGGGETTPDENPNAPASILELRDGLAAPDYTKLDEVHSVRGLLDNTVDKRAAWALRRAEVIDIFQYYELEKIVEVRGRLGEVAMIRYIRNHISPQVCPSCVDKTYDDTRWHKVTDNDEPIRVAMSAPAFDRIGHIIEEVLDEWVEGSEKLQFEIVGLRDPHDVFIEYGPIDGRRGVLGYVSRIEKGDLGQTRVRMRLDSAEQWVPFMIRSVLKHEVGHMIGIGHAPRTREYLSDVMFPVYLNIVRVINGWTLQQRDAKYGELRVA